MTITINGSGTITGLSAGGLPDATIQQADLAANVAGNGPAFSAYQSSAQTISSATFTKLNFQTEDFDTNGNFASSTFTPTVAGYYQISGGIYFATTSGIAILEIRKNGAAWKRLSGSPNPTNAFNDVGGSALVYLNGSTDYVELYFFQNSGGAAAVPFAQSDLVYFQGAMVRAA